MPLPPFSVALPISLGSPVANLSMPTGGLAVPDGGAFGSSTRGLDHIAGNAINPPAGPPVRRDITGVTDNALRGAQTAPPQPPPVPDFASVLGLSAPGAALPPVSFDVNSGLEPIRRAQQEAAEALAALDTLHEQRKAELSSRYQLAETDEERARLQRVLEVIELQRSEGTQVIERVYTQAIEGATARAEQVRQTGAQAATKTAETFTQGAEDLGESFAALNQEMGGAMGAGGEPLSPVAQAAMANMHRQAQTEAAFDRRLFDLTAADIQFLGEAMRPEMGAQIGALQGDALRASTVAQVEHGRGVQDRVSRERAMYNQALADLAQQMDSRRFGLEDTRLDLGIAESNRMAENQQHFSGLQESRRQEQARLAAAQAAQTQELALRQAEMRYERDMEAWRQQQEVAALRGLGASPSQASFARALGLEQDLGVSLLFPAPQPPMMNPLQSGRIQ